jgi:hypothetical protein
MLNCDSRFGVQGMSHVVNMRDTEHAYHDNEETNDCRLGIGQDDWKSVSLLDHDLFVKTLWRSLL